MARDILALSQNSCQVCCSM